MTSPRQRPRQESGLRLGRYKWLECGTVRVEAVCASAARRSTLQQYEGGFRQRPSYVRQFTITRERA
jgi:hypothetical protein